MKTITTALRSTALIFVAILLIHCTKEKEITGTDISTNTQAISGAIVDHGVVTGEIRHMNVSLTGVYTLLNGSADNPEQTSSNITLELYTDTDGIISEGIYVFSESPNPEPFTFKTGTVFMSTSETEYVSGYLLNGGAISVVRDGTSYKISLEGTLVSGHTINSSFDGHLSYKDAN